MAAVVKIERNKDILVDELQFMYHQNGKNKQETKIFWECIERKQKSCTARIHTKSKDHNYEIVKRINEHVHQSTKSKVDAKVAIQELKEEVVKSNHPTRSLIANCLSSLDDCGRAELRNVQHLSRNV